MNAQQKQTSLSRAASEKQSTSAQPEQQQLPATLVQKLFIAGLYLYLLSLVWLTLSHNWYGVLPKWLDPH
jgi:hypothetical protein